jgi:hypothetical protein
VRSPSILIDPSGGNRYGTGPVESGTGSAIGGAKWVCGPSATRETQTLFPHRPAQKMLTKMLTERAQNTPNFGQFSIFLFV